MTSEPSGARTVTGANAPPRGGDVRIGDEADDEEAGGPGDGERAVEVAGVLGRRAGEVDVDRVARHGHHDPDLEVAVHCLDHIRRLVATVRQAL